MKTLDWVKIDTRTTSKQTALAIVDAAIGILTLGAFVVMVSAIFIMIG